VSALPQGNVFSGHRCASSRKIGLRLLSRILEWANPSEAKRLYMAIELTKESRQNAINSIQKYFEANLEGRIGNLEANALLGFILEEIGPSIYNKGVTDAQERMQARLSDLDYEIHEDEFQYWRNLERRQKGRK
jgi:uncharacterized protein (DUF2164 family)